MIGLLLLSILSWAIIIQRYKLLKTAQKQRQDFETKFWSGIDLNVLYKELNPQKVSGLERLFLTLELLQVGLLVVAILQVLQDLLSTEG